MSTPEAPPAVVVRDLTKRFMNGRTEAFAVRELSFECRAGEVLGLLGINGAGKTTTLRMLATLLAPTSGAATIGGHDLVREPAEVRACLGFLSASTALYPRMTARETLTFFARINGYPRERLPARIDELVARFRLDRFIDTAVDKLSSGMRQRVSIARAIAHDPPVLVLDEPTVGLDVLATLDLLETVAELRRSGKAIVYSTHIMSEAEKVCDRVAILHEGRILACDTPPNLQDRTGEHRLEDVFVRVVREGAS